MKKYLLLFSFVLLTYTIQSQTVLFYEDFEPPSLGDLVISSMSTSGVPDWGLCSNLSAGGVYSDTCKVKNLATTYLTTLPFNTIGHDSLRLEFSHISKINYFDTAMVEVSGDGGQTWVQLMGTEYLGISSFAPNGSKFGPQIYGLDWFPQNNLEKPFNSWFRQEAFDISGICGNKSAALIRFKLIDGGGAPNNPEYGWIIDNIKVTSSGQDVSPPTIVSFTPILTDSIFNPGSYPFHAQAIDVSGIQSVFIAYTLNGVPNTLFMTPGFSFSFTATMPKVKHLDQICYKLVVIDNSPNHNTSYLPATGYYCFTVYTQDASILTINSPTTSYGLGLEPVTILIKNNGQDTISGNLSASYYITGTSDTIMQLINSSLPPGQIMSFTFDTLIDVTATDDDKLFDIQSKINLLGDLDHLNNQMGKSIISGFMPPPPDINDTIIAYASSVTLHTGSNLSIHWYTDSLGLNKIHTGSSFTTPILYASATYYARAETSILKSISQNTVINITVGPPPLVDVEIENLLAPYTSALMTANEPVKIKLMNHGLQGVSNFPLYYSVNNGTPILELFTGWIPPGGSSDFTFSLPVDLSLTGVYEIKVYCSVPGDSIQFNDTLTKTIEHIVPNYCLSYAIVTTGDSDIGNVTISNLNNGNPLPLTNNPNSIFGYTNFTVLPPIELVIGQSYPISISKINFGSSNPPSVIKVYIDYNRDGVFDPSSEMVFKAHTDFLTYTVNGQIKVPGWLSPGLTRMRVVLRETSKPSGVLPCGTYGKGETEDYLVEIIKLFPLDAGVIQIIQPSGIGNVGAVSPVMVEVRNFGMLPLDSLRLTYYVNSGTPVSYLHLTPIAPHSNVFISLPSITLVNGVNHICAYSILPGDSNPINDMHCSSVLGQAVLNPPFFTDFDGIDYHFWPQHFPSQWERGVPSAQVINSAYSAPNAWVTNLTGPYVPSQIDYLYSPKFFHLAKGVDSLIFYHKIHTPTNAGGGIQYLSWMGWKYLGSQNDPKGVNWYNTPAGIWSGNGGSTGWMRSAYCIKNIFDMSEPTQFRFFFYDASYYSNNYEGWAIDNFSLTVSPLPIDAGIVEIITPVTPLGTSMTAKVRLKNHGTDTLTQIPLGYTINGALMASGLWMGQLLPKDTATFSFPAITTPAANFDLCAYTQVPADTNFSNDTVCSFFNLLAPISTSITANDYSHHPLFNLGQNIPNPASDHTIISFSIPEQGEAIFRVMNFLGQTIHSEQLSKNQGTHQINLDISAWPPGIYVYNLWFMDKKLSRKMIVE